MVNILVAAIAFGLRLYRESNNAILADEPRHTEYRKMALEMALSVSRSRLIESVRLESLRGTF